MVIFQDGYLSKELISTTKMNDWTIYFVHINFTLNFCANKWETMCISILWGTEQRPIYAYRLSNCFINFALQFGLKLFQTITLNFFLLLILIEISLGKRLFYVNNRNIYELSCTVKILFFFSRPFNYLIIFFTNYYIVIGCYRTLF